MRLPRALLYFLAEAAANVARGWRISSLAVATTAVSLFLGGALLLAGSNLGRSVASWQSEARVLLYPAASAGEVDLAELEARLAGDARIRAVRLVTSEEASERLRGRFPELVDAIEADGEVLLPRAFELELETGAGDELAAELAGWEGVEALDDDREWLGSVDTVAGIVRLAGIALGALLMVAAAVTIASVVRLSTLIHRGEISAMRLIGATEFFVRGPFVAEGVLQGAAGSILALGALRLAYEAAERWTLPWVVRETLLAEFLSVPQTALVVLLGTVAGLAGGLIPLRDRTGVFG